MDLDPKPPLLDMTPEGRFTEPKRPSVAGQIGRFALIVALIAGGLGLAALAFWFALLLIPLALIASLVAWVALRFYLWQVSRGSGSRRRGFRP